MNGTYKCSRNYRSLALSVLGGIGLAALAVPALASNQVNVNVSPTTGYYEVTPRTYRVPPNARVSGLPATPTVSSIPSGGLSQSISSGIEITGLKDNRGYGSTINASVRAGASALKNGATRCLTSFRCNLAMAGGAAGLQALLDGLDWVMDEGGKIQKSSGKIFDGVPSGFANSTSASSNTSFDSCPPRTGSTCVRSVPFGSRPSYTNYWCPNTRSDYPLTGYTHDGSTSLGRCYYGGSVPPPETTPVSDADIQSGVANNYTPDPSDWRWLTAGIDLSAPDVDIEVVDIPSITGSGSPDFIEWSDGTSQGTYNEFDFSVSGNPGKQPSISARETTTTTEYDAQGNPTGTVTSTTVSSSSTLPPVEVPTDCEFMPTVCRFIDWFTEPDPSPDPDQEIRDLVQVYEDGGRDVDVGPSVGSCPPPRVIALSFVPAVEVSYQPFCDLAASFRYWLLAIAYFGAAYLTVRSI